MQARRDQKKIEEILRSYLSLKYQLVGVKVIKCESRVSSSQPHTPIAFCHMIRKAAANRESFLYGLDFEKCPTAQIVLGFREPRYKVDYAALSPTTRRVSISSLSESRYLPDVVLTILTPKQMMDLTIILQAERNEPLLALFRGQSSCADFFAKPYVEGKPNISLLCNGAREVYSDFRDNELIFGAPLEVYLRAAETIERITKMSGAICGCRTNDIPAEIANEFEKIGFSKATDFFFGKVDGYNVRVYLNKDIEGRLNLTTFYLPIKTSSEEKAEKLSDKLRHLLPKMYSVKKRGYWLDLAVSASEESLGIDLFDGISIKNAVARFIGTLTPYLSQIKEITWNGEY